MSGFAQAGRPDSDFVPGKRLPMNRPAGVRADDDPKVEPFMLHHPNTRASARAATMAHAHADVTSRHPLVLGIALGAVLSVALTAGTASSAAAAVDAHSDAVSSLITSTGSDADGPATGAVAMSLPLVDITEDAQTAVATAQIAVADAAALTAEVAASGLTLDTATTAIDTSALEAGIADLAVAVDADTAEPAAEDAEADAAGASTAAVPATAAASAASESAAPTDTAAPATAAEFAAAAAAAEVEEKAPLELVLDTADITADAAEVTAATTTLRAALTAAQQAAAEKKAAEERAAAAAAAAAAANTPEGAKATARAMAASEYGWGDGEFSCLESLWNKESGWNYKAYNPSGATGIPQSLPGDKMASAGADWRTNATTQIAWGLGYIDSVYGSPCSAWGHSQATNWY